MLKSTDVFLGEMMPEICFQMLKKKKKKRKEKENLRKGEDR